MSDISFSAAVLDSPGQPLRIETVTVPSTPPPGEVLVRLKASGLCHSDLHVIDGEWDAPVPMILGHEGAGIVEKIGAGVTGLQEGDHVVLSWTPSCRRCEYCVTGRPVLCDLVNEMSGQHLSFDGTTRVKRSDGTEIHSFVAVGTFGEYVVVPESGAIRIRPDAPFEQAALVGCAVTTGIGAVVNTAKVRPGASVLVIGCGGVGLNAIQGARLAGARQIIAADISEVKLQQARAFGATETVNSAHEDLPAAIDRLTGGRGIEYAVEAIGLKHTLETAYAVLARGGTAVVAGQVADGVTISIDPFVMSDQEKSLIGSNYGSSRPAVDFPHLIDLYMAGAIDLDSLVTDRISLDQINDSFDAMRRGEGIRTVIQY